MIADAILAAAIATTSTTPPARLWQVESAGWERLAGECLGELQASRADARRLRLLQLPTPMSSSSSSWRPALLGGLAGAAIAGGTAAGLACDEARCRGAGIAVGAVALVAAVVMLLSL